MGIELNEGLAKPATLVKVMKHLNHLSQFMKEDIIKLNACFML